LAITNYIFSTIGKSLNKKPAYTNYNINKNKRYFSSVDADIYFNNTHLSEIVQIQWTVEEMQNPIYGYNSYIFDYMACGTRLVNGIFAINFIAPDYLNLVTADIGDDESRGYLTSGSKYAQATTSPMFGKKFDISISYGQEDKISTNIPYVFLSECYVSSQGQSIDTSGGNIVEMYKFIGRDKTHTTST
jgi:hypothetical protein